MTTGLRWHGTPSHYATANVGLFWKIADATLQVDATAGYASGPGLSGSSNAAYGIDEPETALEDGQTFAVGMRVRINALPAAEKILLGVTGADRVLRACVALLPSGLLAVYKGNLGTLLAITASPVTTGVQLRLGFSGTLATSGGTVQLDIDGDTVASATGLDTGAAAWAGVYVGAGPDIHPSHYYAADDGILRPAYLIDTAFSNNAALDDTNPDGDTTTVSLAAVGEEILSGLTSPTSRRVIYGVQTIATVKQSTGGAFAPILEVDGTPYTSPAQDVVDTYVGLKQFYRLNPATDLPFDGSDLALLEMGGESQ